MCCDPSHSKKEHDAVHVGQCPECDCDVDKDGDCCMTDNCNYSPKLCSTCGYCPCDQSC